MASVADQLASNINLGAFAKATELKKRIWFALGCLVVYRLGTYIPLPGIDPTVMAQIFAQQSGGVLGMFNMFAGGALERMSIFALGILPYISASIILQLMAAVSPTIETLKKEGESGRKKINQYTRYLTVVLAAFQAYGLAVGLEAMEGPSGSAVIAAGWFFRLTTVITIVGGTVFLMWLGEQITARGIGNGISLIIFVGIIAQLPSAVAAMLELGRTGAMSPLFILFLIVFAVALITFIVFMERAQRRLIVQYPKRMVGGNRMFGGESTHMPLKLNTSGVIPAIFASSLLLLPATVGGFAGQGGPEWLLAMTAMLGYGQPLHTAIFAALIIFFTFFYTSIVFNPQDTAENLRKHGGFIPGIRPGQRTAEHIDYVLTRLTTVGALYLAAVCVLPEILIAQYGVPFYFGGTSILIVVSVTMDTVGQIQAHLWAHQYDSLIKKARLRGKRG
jgi:preprotein translocase subunit SecY